jgi:transcriptional regulator with XRE-family HTH domain
MITERQLAAARVLARLSLAALAEQSGVSEATIRHAEATDDTPTTRGDNLARLVRALEDAGVVFLAAAARA